MKCSAEKWPHIGLMPMPDGRWEWDVFYPLDENENGTEWRDKSRSQYGYVDTLDEAFVCIKKVVETYGLMVLDD